MNLEHSNNNKFLTEKNRICFRFNNLKIQSENFNTYLYLNEHKISNHGLVLLQKLKKQIGSINLNLPSLKLVQITKQTQKLQILCQCRSTNIILTAFDLNFDYKQEETFSLFSEIIKGFQEIRQLTEIQQLKEIGHFIMNINTIFILKCQRCIKSNPKKRKIIIIDFGVRQNYKKNQQKLKDSDFLLLNFKDLIQQSKLSNNIIKRLNYWIENYNQCNIIENNNKIKTKITHRKEIVSDKTKYQTTKNRNVNTQYSQIYNRANINDSSFTSFKIDNFLKGNCLQSQIENKKYDLKLSNRRQSNRKQNQQLNSKSKRKLKKLLFEKIKQKKGLKSQIIPQADLSFFLNKPINRTLLIQPREKKIQIDNHRNHFQEIEKITAQILEKHFSQQPCQKITLTQININQTDNLIHSKNIIQKQIVTNKRQIITQNIVIKKQNKEDNNLINKIQRLINDKIQCEINPIGQNIKQISQLFSQYNFKWKKPLFFLYKKFFYLRCAFLISFSASQIAPFDNISDQQWKLFCQNQNLQKIINPIITQNQTIYQSLTLMAQKIQKNSKNNSKNYQIDIGDNIVDYKDFMQEFANQTIKDYIKLYECVCFHQIVNEMCLLANFGMSIILSCYDIIKNEELTKYKTILQQWKIQNKQNKNRLLIFLQNQKDKLIKLLQQVFQ